jgi:hypothetical protein
MVDKSDSRRRLSKASATVLLKENLSNFRSGSAPIHPKFIVACSNSVAYGPARKEGLSRPYLTTAVYGNGIRASFMNDA